MSDLHYMRDGAFLGNGPLSSLILTALFVVTLLAGPAQAASYDTSRMDQFPDFSQTDPALNLPAGGIAYCVPVATANALVWYAEERGFSGLLPVKGLSMTEKVSAVARQLGENRYMSTAPKGGTSLARFMHGLSGYIADAGYSSKIAYRGRWPMPSKYGRIEVGVPDIEYIQDKFSSGAAVFLSLGYYNEGDRHGELKRGAGHFVTVVGFGVDKSGNVDRDYVVLHDPGDGTRSVTKRYLKLELLRQGTFVDRKGNESDASEHLVVTDGMRLRNYSTIIIDAVVALDL
jgi:hypothetical protein